MLCPNCGTDVGERARLCPRCEAQSASSGEGSAPQSGGHLGAIRPAVKVVRLKPGETRESYLQNLASENSQGQDSASSQSAFGGQYRAAASESSYSQTNSSHGQKHYTEAYGTQYKRSPAVPFLILLTLAILLPGSLYLLRSQGSFNVTNVLPKGLEVEKQTPDFAHIVIHEKKEVVVDGKDVIGMFSIDQEPWALQMVNASWNPGKNVLTLTYSPREGKPTLELAEPTSEQKAHPELIMALQFASGTQKLDTNKLQSYTVDLRTGETKAAHDKFDNHEPSSPSKTESQNSFHFYKEYSKRLAEFGEISQLSGTLKAGEKIHGNFKDSRTNNVGDSTSNISWELTLDATLQIENPKK